MTGQHCRESDRRDRCPVFLCCRGCRGRCCRTTRTQIAWLRQVRSARPGACTGLKFSIEKLTLVVEAISYASRRLDAKQNSCFQLSLLIVKETVLPEESDVAEAKGIAAVKDDRIERIGGVALADASAANPRESHAHGEV